MNMWTACWTSRSKPIAHPLRIFSLLVTGDLVSRGFNDSKRCRCQNMQSVWFGGTTLQHRWLQGGICHWYWKLIIQLVALHKKHYLHQDQPCWSLHDFVYFSALFWCEMVRENHFCASGSVSFHSPCAEFCSGCIHK